LIAEVANAALADLRPPTDVHASADYRLQLARTLTARAVARAFSAAAQ
jgi:CO/xanthine dehydrogenase FAD-binding subunit